MRYFPDYITQEHLDRANSYIESLDDLAALVHGVATNSNAVIIATDINSLSYKENRDRLTINKSIINPFDILKILSQNKNESGSYHKYSLDARKVFNPPMVDCEYKEFVQPFNFGPGYEERMLSEKYYRKIGLEFVSKVANLQYKNQNHNKYFSTYWYPSSFNLPPVRLSKQNYFDYMSYSDKLIGGVEHKILPSNYELTKFYWNKL